MLKTTLECDFDKEAKNIGLIVGVPQEIYFCCTSNVTTVYFEKINEDWESWRESYVPNLSKARSSRTIAKGSFEYVLARTKNYLKYLKTHSY